MATAIIVTLEDGVQWHANYVFAIAASLGLRAEVRSILSRSGPIAEKPIMQVFARDGARLASSFPATNVFCGLPGVIRVETRDEPDPPSSAIPLADDTHVAGELFCSVVTVFRLSFLPASPELQPASPSQGGLG